MKVEELFKYTVTSISVGFLIGHHSFVMFINLDTASLLRGAMGGVLIGASSAILLRLTGRTLGVSSILSSASSGRAGLGSWQLSFLAGLSASGAALSLSFPVVFGSATAVAPGATAAAALVAGGALVGWGTAEGCGCTSGHGVSGLGRLSPRSATAVGTFMAVGAAVAYASAQLALTGGGAAAAQRSAMGAVLTAAAPLVATVALGAAWASRRRVAAAAPTAADVTPLSQHVAAALCGAMFGAGLGLSGMADPAKVRAGGEGGGGRKWGVGEGNACSERELGRY